MKTFSIKYLWAFFFVVVYASMSFGLNSDPPVVTLGRLIADDDGTPPIVHYELESCETKIRMRVLLANLFYFDPEPTDDGEDYLPDGYPDMYLQYSINGGPVVTEQLYAFQWIETSNPFGGKYLFEAFVDSYEVNLQDECEAIPPEEDHFILNYSMKLVTVDYIDPISGKTLYKQYPACDYVGENDIFSCKVFSSAQGACNGGLLDPSGTNGLEISDDEEATVHFNEYAGARTDTEGCDQDGLTSGHQALAIHCPGCISGGEGGSGSSFGGSQGRNETSDFIRDEEHVTVSPNPFSNHLAIRLSEKNSVEKLELLDTNGRLIKVWNESQLSTSTIFNINTENFSKGVYFLRSKSADASNVIKIVKQ